MATSVNSFDDPPDYGLMGEFRGGTTTTVTNNINRISKKTFIKRDAFLSQNESQTHKAPVQIALNEVRKRG
jgi:hypothetical protein